MTELTTRVESTGFYAGQNRWVAIAVKVMVVSLVLWASLANDAGDILMDIQSATIGYFRGWYVYASAAFMVMSLALALMPSVPVAFAWERTTPDPNSVASPGFR